jgi:putative hydrolase of the HAD superfamily
MNSPPYAITFDLWHTLLYLEPEAEEQYMDRLLEAATEVLEASPLIPDVVRLDREELRATFEREFARAVAAALEGRSVSPVEQLIRASRASGRVPQPKAYLAKLEGTLARTPFRVAPNALEVLTELRERGYALGIISNTVGEPGRLIRPVLQRFGFDECIRVFTFSDEHPWSKPAPEIFEAALRALGTEPSAAVHVGDGWSDIEGARRAGMAAGILFTGLQRYSEHYRKLFAPPIMERPEPELRVESLRDVVPLAGRLLGPPNPGGPGHRG